jgi:hypothetical protein
MADTTTRPGVDRRPLIAHLQVQRNTDREMMAILRASAANIDTELKRLATKSGIGALTRTEQLKLSQAAMHREMAVMWTRLGDTIAAGKAEAAAAAVTGMLNPDILKAILPPGDLAYLTRSVELSAVQGLGAAEARLRYSKIPLAESVYKNEALSSGKIDKIVDNALARGASAAELAKDVRAFVNPNTPGGVRYAAQRLGRTELNNSFHATQVRQAQREPWVQAVKWEISGSHPQPDECDDYAEGTFFVGGGAGEWLPQDVPQKPHPNCLCFTTPVAMDRDAFINGFMKGDFDSYLEEEFGPFEMPAISPNRALHEYAWGKGSNDTGLMYIEINDALRTGKALAPGAQRVAAGIDKAFDLIEPLKSGSRVYRQIPGQDRELVNRILASARKSGTFADEGYMSTTKSADILADFDIEGTGVRLNIQTPAGSKVIRMDDFLDANDPAVFSQDEYLLPRGTKLRLNPPRREGSGWVVDAEVESDAVKAARAAKPPAPVVSSPVETAQLRVNQAMARYKATAPNTPAQKKAWSNLQAARAELKVAKSKPVPVPAPAPAATPVPTAAESLSRFAQEAPKTPKYVIDDLTQKSSRLSPDLVDAVDDYVSNGAFAQINSTLRGVDLGGSSVDDFGQFFQGAGVVDAEEALGYVMQQVEVLDEAVRSARFMTEGYVYRGVDSAALGDIRVGARLIDQGYMSTSYSPSYAAEWPGETVMRIKVPAGQPALSIDGVIPGMGQGEVLLPRGTVLKITKITKVGEKRVVYASIVPG